MLCLIWLSEIFFNPVMFKLDNHVVLILINNAECRTLQITCYFGQFTKLTSNHAHACMGFWACNIINFFTVLESFQLRVERYLEFPLPLLR